MAGEGFTDRTRGVALTKYDPYFHDDGTGGLVCRVIADDGQVFNRAVSRETAARMIATLALFVARDA